MSTDVNKSWLSVRLPWLAEAQACFLTPKLAREAPYLGMLPALITSALLLMAASGFVLSVYYNPWHGFASIQFIDRDVSNGWLIHAFHETGTTMIFGAVYLALFRGILTRAYKAPGEFVWLLGVKQFVLLLLVGWLGYLLTDGAVSYWNLTGSADAAAQLNGLPGAIGTWFFGGVNGPGTLGRMLTLHIVLALGIFAIIWLHHNASKAVAPAVSGRNAVSFHPYYTSQFFVALVVFALIFCVLAFFAPHLGENHVNAAASNPLVVPTALTPPWYLAPLDGLGSLLPGIGGAIVGVVAGLAVIFALPWLDRSGPHGRPGFLYRCLAVLLALDVVALGCAASGATKLDSILVVVFAVWYFLHFLVLTPLVTAMEAE